MLVFAIFPHKTKLLSFKLFQLNLNDNIKLVYVLKNKIPFEIFTPAKIVKSLLTVAIATIKAYCDKYTYILVNHTKQDQFFLSTLRLRYACWHLSTFIHLYLFISNVYCENVSFTCTYIHTTKILI